MVLTPDQRLASDFWAWRARTAQYTNDDVTRIERPFGVDRDWSAAAIAKQRAQLANFDERWSKLGNPADPFQSRLIERLIGSALARVHWELDILDAGSAIPTSTLSKR